jgi:hypothetical protein
MLISGGPCVQNRCALRVALCRQPLQPDRCILLDLFVIAQDTFGLGATSSSINYKQRLFKA